MVKTEIKVGVGGNIMQLQNRVDGYWLPAAPSNGSAGDIVRALKDKNLCTRATCSIFDACKGLKTLTISGGLRGSENFAQAGCALNGASIMVDSRAIEVGTVG